MSRRMWVVAVAAWVAVVIAGSGLTWFAIERAGDQVSVTPDSAGSTRAPELGTVGPAPTTTATAATPSPSGTPTSTAPRPTRRPAPVTSHPSASPKAPSRPSTAPPVPQPSKAPAPPVVRAEVRTWTGAAGSLTVACTGGQVSFRSATPGNGWTFERGDASGEDIEVTFKSAQGQVQVRATCSGGVPQFQVESSSPDH